MKPWIYIFITTEKLNFAKMSVTTLLHSHDDIALLKDLYLKKMLVCLFFSNLFQVSNNFLTLNEKQFQVFKVARLAKSMI